MAEDALPQKKDDSNGDLENIAKKLQELDPKIFEGIPNQKRKQILSGFKIVVSKTHIGPLPSPESLREYSEIIPNGADRIMKMAENQSQHRIEIEKKVITSQLSQSNTGQYLAFLIGIAALSAATICILKGFEWGGGIIGLGGLTGLVTAFIKGRSQQATNLEEKRPHNKK